MNETRLSAVVWASRDPCELDLENMEHVQIWISTEYKPHRLFIKGIKKEWRFYGKLFPYEEKYEPIQKSLGSE